MLVPISSEFQGSPAALPVERRSCVSRARLAVVHLPHSRLSVCMVASAHLHYPPTPVAAAQPAPTQRAAADPGHGFVVSASCVSRRLETHPIHPIRGLLAGTSPQLSAGLSAARGYEQNIRARCGIAQVMHGGLSCCPPRDASPSACRCRHRAERAERCCDLGNGHSSGFKVPPVP